MALSETTTVVLELIKIIVPTLTILAAWTDQRRKLAKNNDETRTARAELSDKVDAVKEMADGHLTKALADLSTVKKELARVNAGGVPTPVVEPGAVTQSPEGGITVENRREGDLK